MTVTALGVDRITGYPRALVEPLLWLAVTTGVLWLLVAVDARGKTSTGAAPIETGVPALAAALALVLILNGASALLLAQQGGSIARGVAALAGLGLALSGWAFHEIPEIDPQVRNWLFLGSIVAGIALAGLAQLHWRQIGGVPGGEERGTVELLLISGLVVLAVLIGYAAYGGLDRGLVGVGSRQESAWDDVIPATQGIATLLATMGQLWNRRWLAAVVTLGVGGFLTAALFVAAG